MDPVEILKWAGGITAALGGSAFGIKRLLTVWGRETAQSSGISAANSIIDSLRADIERGRKETRYFSEENSAAQVKIAELQKQITNLLDANHRLELNNKFMKTTLLDAGRSIADGISHVPTFSDSNIGDLK